MIEHDVYEMQDKAFVDFEENALVVRGDVYKAYLAGYNDAIDVFWHEIGHLLMHDKDAVPYTEALQRNPNSAFGDNERAEWQANVFLRRSAGARTPAEFKFYD